MSIVGNAVGCYSPIGKTFTLVDENNNEITGVIVDQEVVFTATDNDVRTGLVYASESGVSIGVNDIPAYHTTEGKRIIKAGSEFSIPLSYLNTYDYTALQVLICAYNTSLTDSVATDRVVVSDNVYNVNSIDVLATISKDHINKSINLNIVNNTENKFVLRYFTYKEI